MGKADIKWAGSAGVIRPFLTHLSGDCAKLIRVPRIAPKERQFYQAPADFNAHLLLVLNNQTGDTYMLTKMKVALAVAIVLGTASTALARGYVLPGSTDGVNPAYHPRWFPQYGRVLRAYDRANAEIYSGTNGGLPNETRAYAPARALQRHIHQKQH